MSILTNQRRPDAQWTIGLPRFTTNASRDAGQARAEQRLVVSLALVAIPAFLLLLSGMLAGRPLDDGHIERGVTVGGYAVDGDHWDSAAANLIARFDAYMSESIIFEIDGTQTAISPADLGLSFDIDATRERALAVGRGPMLVAGAERLRAHTLGVDLDPVVTFDPVRLSATLEAIGARSIHAPTDSEFHWTGTSLLITPASDGVAIDASATAAELEKTVLQLSHGPIVVSFVPIKPAVSTSDLESMRGKVEALLREPLLVSSGNTYWQITPQALAGMLTVRDGKLAVNTLALRPIIDSLVPSIDQPARDAAIVHVGGGTFRVEPEQIRRALDVAASVAAIERGILAGEHQIALVTSESTPDVTAELLQPLAKRANEIAERGMVVWYSDFEYAFDRGQYGDTMQFDTDTLTITFDEQALFEMLVPAAHSINRPASGYRWLNWEVVAPDGAIPGRQVDIIASVKQLTARAFNGEGSSQLVVSEFTHDEGEIASIQLNDMLGTASTYYGSSNWNRRTNVELAAQSLNGALVRPGGTFSFNQAIGGTATLDDGYQVGFGIVTNQDGVPMTVPSVAGGICQVATTVFQAAWWAGMPIGTRSWHSYWIPNYGNGPGGMRGLDATVDPDYGLDFTFHNPTDQWLGIRAVADGEWLTVEVWGTNQGWAVIVDEPVITNVVKADQAQYEQVSDLLEPGQRVNVEFAHDGFTATHHRVVKKGDEIVDEVYLTSYYQPSRNVTLVGRGTPAPDPTPTHTPEPVIEEPAVETPVEEAPADTAVPDDSGEETTPETE